jgi:hypothetical protein
LKELIRRIPVLGPWVGSAYRRLAVSLGRRFPGSGTYWERRYSSGGDSGVGSYGRFAAFKAEVINTFVEQMGAETVIEFGCGDGNQLTLARYPRYIGFDVSESALARCKERFAADTTKEFELADRYRGQTADLVLSLDVIYHLVEDDVFEKYMRRLFAAAARFVIVYSSDTDDNRGYAGTHVRHRRFSQWVADNIPGWRLTRHLPNRYPYSGDYRAGSFADFFIFEPNDPGDVQPPSRGAP